MALNDERSGWRLGEWMRDRNVRKRDNDGEKKWDDTTEQHFPWQNALKNPRKETTFYIISKCMIRAFLFE